MGLGEQFSLPVVDLIPVPTVESILGRPSRMCEIDDIVMLVCPVILRTAMGCVLGTGVFLAVYLG